MIEPKLIDWVELGDSIQKMYIYTSSYIQLFSFFRIMLKYKLDKLLLIFFLKAYFYIQFMMIPVIKTPQENVKYDTLLKFLTSIKKIIFVQDIIDSKRSFLILISIVFIYCSFLIVLLIYLMLNINNPKIRQAPMKFLNLLNLFLIHAFLCPIINILMLTTKCEENKHIFLDVKCYSNFSHLIIVIVSMFFLFFIIIYSIMLSIYYYEIGGIKGVNSNAKINSNYEFYSNLLGIISFFIGYFIEYYSKGYKLLFRIVNRIYIFIGSFFLAVYSYNRVLHYNPKLNNLNIYCWSLVSWYSFSLILKQIFDITNCVLLVLIGWLINSIIIFILTLSHKEYYLTEFNILEAKTLKDIEMFTSNLLNIAMDNSNKSKTLLIGLIKTLQDYFENNPELYDKFKKFKTNEALISKHGGTGILLFDVYNIIYNIYDYYLEKTELKNDVLLVFCYFLANKLKNMTYVLSLCSKMKFSNHKLIYLKFLLIEDLMEYFILKLTKKAYIKDTLKNVEIGSVILYNIYLDKLKVKIYDAACNQIDYFDVLRNNTNTQKSTSSFLKFGNSILKIRKEILDIWNKIIDLNPFSDETEKDYMLYLETIIQDEGLAQKEKKRYNMIKASKLSERNNIYHSLFIKEISSIILVDGNNHYKIVYTTANFPILFNYSQKEVLNFSIHDLIPPCIAEFHKELIEDSIRYSNLTHLFNKKSLNFLLKSKSNGVYSVNIYIKSIPNLSYGLIFICLIEKIQSNQFLIILDEDFKINCMSDPLSLVTYDSSVATDVITYGLTFNLLGHHIGLIIPEIFKYIKFSEGKFCFTKNDIDIKSSLFSNIANFHEDEQNIGFILEKIKDNGHLNLEDNNMQTFQTVKKVNTISKYKNDFNMMEYHHLIRNLKQKLGEKTFSIFYRMISKYFLNGKYSYYRMYITNDLLGANANQEEKSEKEIENSIMGNVNGFVTGILSESLLPNLQQNFSKKERGIKIKNYDEEKIIYNKEEENKEKQNNLMNNINIKNNIYHLHNKENVNNNNEEEQEPISHNSLLTKSSIDSASFNKLKSRILDKNETFHITYLRFLSIFFLVISIILVYLNNKAIKTTFNDLLYFLEENYFFNYTKIVVSNIYITAINSKFIRLGIIKDPIQIDMTATILFKLIDKLSLKIGKIPYFEDEYEQILSVIKYMDVYIYDLNTVSEIAVDGGNLLSFILSNGIRLRVNFDRYCYNDESGTFEVYCRNLINSSHYYIHNKDIEGLNIETKIKIAKSEKFQTDLIFLIINIVIFILIFSIFIWLDHKLYEIEINFLEKLIMFRTKNFDVYLQYLEELKKKLKKVSDEEKSEEEQNESNEINNEDKDDKGLSQISKFIKKKTNEKKSEFEKTVLKSHKEDKRKHKGKVSKIQQQKREKIEIMGKYFIVYNVLFCFKVCGTVFLVITNYLVVYIFYSKRREDFFQLDNLMNEMIGIYKDNYLIYSYFKEEIFSFENYELEKQEYIKQLENNEIQNITINNIIYTKDNIKELNETHYLYDINYLSQSRIKSFGNSLMYLKSKKIKKSLYNQLKVLYSEDSCYFLFNDNQTTFYYCSNFWSSILTKGIEPTTTQLNIDLSNLLNYFIQVNNKEIINLSSMTNNIFYIEVYITFYFMWSFEKTIEIFESIRKDYINDLITKFNVIFAIYFIIALCLFISLNITIYSAKENFNSFLNFIGILPIQYLSEDDIFYRETLKLEGDIFY